MVPEHSLTKSGEMQNVSTWTICLLMPCKSWQDLGRLDTILGDGDDRDGSKEIANDEDEDAR